MPKSGELPSALVLLASILVLYFISEWFFDGIGKMTRFYLGEFNEIEIPDSPQKLRSLLYGLVYESGIILAPVLAAGVLFAIIGNLVQVGFMFTAKPLSVKWDRIRPNFRKILFSTQTVVNLLKSVIKIFLITWVSYLLIKNDFIMVLKTSGADLGDSLKIIGWISFKLIVVIGVIMFVLALPDYLYQKYEFTESIKMSKQEIKDEFRETHGDVHIRQRQKERAKKMLRENMLNEVPKATVVITNPTHYAVALRYDADIDPNPVVVAKGEENLAQRIKAIARANGVEIRESPLLARELYHSVELGEPVPERFFQLLVRIFQSLEKFKIAGSKAV